MVDRSSSNLTNPMVSSKGSPVEQLMIDNAISIVPVVVPQAQGGGGFSGYWVTLDVTQTYLEYESLIAWNVYYCVTGNPFRESSPKLVGSNPSLLV